MTVSAIDRTIDATKRNVCAAFDGFTAGDFVWGEAKRRTLALIDDLVAERDALQGIVVRQEQRIAELTEGKGN